MAHAERLDSLTYRAGFWSLGNGKVWPRFSPLPPLLVRSLVFFKTVSRCGTQLLCSQQPDRQCACVSDLQSFRTHLGGSPRTAGTFESNVQKAQNQVLPIKEPFGRSYQSRSLSENSQSWGLERGEPWVSLHWGGLRAGEDLSGPAPSEPGSGKKVDFCIRMLHMSSRSAPSARCLCIAKGHFQEPPAPQSLAC